MVTSTGLYWLCESEAKSCLNFLPGSEASTTIRGGLGVRLKKDGMLKTTEFKTAEARLKDIAAVEERCELVLQVKDNEDRVQNQEEAHEWLSQIVIGLKDKVQALEEQSRQQGEALKVAA